MNWKIKEEKISIYQEMILEKKLKQIVLNIMYMVELKNL